MNRGPVKVLIVVQCVFGIWHLIWLHYAVVLVLHLLTVDVAMFHNQFSHERNWTAVAYMFRIQ